MRSPITSVAAALALLAPLTAQAAAAAPTAAPGHLWMLVAVVMGFGALGGFVDGLTTDIPYRVNFGGRSLDIGSLGDALAGATAAIAIFSVAGALFPDAQLDDFGAELDHSIRIVAVSVLSGYAGVRLLNPMTRKLVEQISADKAREATRTLKVRADELTINIKDGDRQLYRFDFERAQLLAAGDLAKAYALLDGARRSFDIALKLDPLDLEGLMGAAKVARRRAELHEVEGKGAEADWNEALQHLDRITSNNPRSARAFYNKACYRQIRRKSATPDPDALRDLETALELQPELGPRAAGDPDFAGIKDTPEFKSLLR